MKRVEDAFALTVLAAMSVLPLLEILVRTFLGGGIPGSIPLVQHLTLWITFVGAALAARSDRLLALSTASFLPERWRGRVRILTAGLASGVSATLFLASCELVRVDFQYAETVAWGIPLWLFSAIMPVGFAVVTGRMIAHASDRLAGRMLAAIGLLIPAVFGLAPSLPDVNLVLPVGLVIVLGTALGMPIFTAIGGAALLLFWDEGTPISAVPGETYRLSTDPMLPAIPLFTLAGFILAEGGSSRRLVRLFSALVGWMPGGLAIATTVVLAFFTPLTGASGITILSLGGLLFPVLAKARYPESTAIGLVTVSGSIGLLFPPSLPVILYAYYAELTIDRLFLGGLLPGALLVAVVAGWGAYRGWRSGAQQAPFFAGEAAAALWEAKWELVVPVIVLSAIFGGIATLVEAAALTALCAFLVECVVFDDLKVTRDLPRVVVESATLVGGFMIILGVALGFTSYLVIAEIPMQALAWVQSHIQSPIVFLLALNVLLILVGALMDIYSAILVIVPLIAPMGVAYGIDPVHLGIIFLANMELGYLMPPMGENLFLSAYRFDRPLARIYRYTVPYMLFVLAAVLLITYVPGMTLWLASWSDR